MVQIPTRTCTHTLPFSVREAPSTRPLDLRGEEPDTKRARRSYAPIRVPRTAAPLAPKSVNITVTAVLFPAEDESCGIDEQWGPSELPGPSPTSSAPKQKRLVAPTVSVPVPSKHKPTPTPAPRITPLQAARMRRSSPLAPHWKASETPIARPRRGRLPPEPLVRKALKAHFAQTPHGAAVVKLGARRAVAQSECVKAVERARRLSSEKVRMGLVGCPGGVSEAQLVPPVVMNELSCPA